MSLKAKLLLDSSDYNKKMDQAKAKAASAGKQIKDKLQQGGRGFEAINKFGGKFGGVLKNLTEGIAGLMSPIGLVMAGVAALGALAVKVWDNMTESAEEYGKKVAIEAERSKKAYENSLKELSGDQAYFQRLQEIRDAEHVSNQMKLQAIRIIEILTKKYGDLGINIDVATGKITGLTDAQKKFLKTAQEIAASKARTALKDQTLVQSAAVNAAMGKKSSNYNPSDFGGGSFGTSMASYWNHDALANGKEGLEDKKNSFLSNADEKKYAGLIIKSRDSIADLQKKLKQNPNSSDAKGQKLRLQQLKVEEAHYVNMLKLTQKLKVARAMIHNSKNNENIDKWRKVEVEIEKTIDAQKEYNLQATLGVQRQKEAAEAAKKASAQADAKVYSKAKQREQKANSQVSRLKNARQSQQKKQQYNNMSSDDKIKYNKSIVAKSRDSIDANNEEIEKLKNKNISNLQQQKKLGQKIKNKVATPEQISRYTQLGKQYALNTATIAQLQAKIQQSLTDIYSAQKEINSIKEKQTKFYEDSQKRLDEQIQLQKLKLQGKTQQAEKQQLINDLKLKGFSVDEAEIDKILEKRRQLAKLNKQLEEKNKSQQKHSISGKSLYDKVQQRLNPLGYEYRKRLEEQQKKKGGALTKDQKNQVRKVIDLEFKADNLLNTKTDLSGLQTLSNELASRGGFTSSVVEASKNDVNERIYQTQKSTENQLKMILTEMKKLGVIQ